MRYVNVTKVKPIYKRQTTLSSERILYKDYDPNNSVQKKNLVSSLKGLDVKANSLAVNGRSNSKCYFDFGV
jgi:hypothetical protein